MTQRLCRVCRGWHRDEEDWPADCMDHWPKSSAKSNPLLSVPMVIQDTMPAIQSQTNGLYYDSKSALRAEYKRADVIELGSHKGPISTPTQPTKAERRAEIRKSLEKAAAKVGL